MGVVTVEDGTVGIVTKASLQSKGLQESVSGDQKQSFRKLTSKKILSVVRVNLLNENDQNLPGVLGHV